MLHEKDTDLITENFYLAIRAMENWITSVSGVVVGVNLYVQRQSLDSLLTAEVCAQTLDCHIDLE